MIKTDRKFVAFTPADILTMVYEEDCNRPKNRKKKRFGIKTNFNLHQRASHRSTKNTIVASSKASLNSKRELLRSEV